MLTKLSNALKALGLAKSVKVYHFHAKRNAELPYIEWAEDTKLDLKAGADHVEAAWQGTIDLYQKDESTVIYSAIEETLSGTVESWYLSSVQYEEENNLIHYEWVWSIA